MATNSTTETLTTRRPSFRSGSLYTYVYTLHLIHDLSSSICRGSRLESDERRDNRLRPRSEREKERRAMETAEQWEVRLNIRRERGEISSCVAICGGETKRNTVAANESQPCSMTIEARLLQLRLDQQCRLASEKTEEREARLPSPPPATPPRPAAQTDWPLRLRRRRERPPPATPPRPAAQTD